MSAARRSTTSASATGELRPHVHTSRRSSACRPLENGQLRKGKAAVHGVDRGVLANEPASAFCQWRPPTGAN